MSLDAFSPNITESDLHKQMKHWIEERMKNESYDTKCEYVYKTNNKTKQVFKIDVIAEKNNQKLPIECHIELTWDFWRRIENYLDYFPKVMIVVPNDFVCYNTPFTLKEFFVNGGKKCILSLVSPFEKIDHNNPHCLDCRNHLNNYYTINQNGSIELKYKKYYGWCKGICFLKESHVEII